MSVILEANDKAVRLIVEDDGKGLPTQAGTSALPATRRFGLLGMRERLALVHGKLDVESGPNKGTTLFISIPLNNAPPVSEQTTL